MCSPCLGGKDPRLPGAVSVSLMPLRLLPPCSALHPVHECPKLLSVYRGYMRSRYNSGCPLCRHGDPCGENPLGENQKRQHPRRREELIRVVRRRGRGKRGVGGGLLCGIGRARGRGRPQEEDPLRDNRSRRGGGRRGGGRGRATTMEEEGEN